MTESKKAIRALVNNILSDNFVPRGTGDYRDYEMAKNFLHRDQLWEPDQWDAAMQSCINYCGV